jgi:hypothetical protein
MISEAAFFRGAWDSGAIVATIAFDPRAAVTWRVHGIATPTITMPDARELRPDLMAYVWNVTGGGNETVTIDDFDGDPIGTIAVGDAAILYLFGNDTAAGTWHLRPATILS